ncbi:hypothetical protein GCG21_08995 [Pseudactinotalea sp. HY160]|uniref:hypothetical protein n=1 Tax=Pseudactinotalea sp. HY160 TaxID=2654490 RepID=UPI00128C12F8|nr:hypothetical protein [Pseudactinotalea sp. HY160]MPV50139.1 hypothetical protein [Pseudactinotalea sp. HY160]
MANASKNKGDRAEREAVEYLRDQVPGLLVENAMRMLGAGRSDDIGDLRVFPDVAVQVRNYKLDSIGAAVRSSAVDARTQAANGLLPHGLGLVPYPRARAGTVRWIATWLTPPAPLECEPVEFKTITKALAWLRDDDGPHGYLTHPRTRRVAALTGPGTEVFVAPAEAWLAAYARARAGADSVDDPGVDGPALDDPALGRADVEGPLLAA